MGATRNSRKPALPAGPPPYRSTALFDEETLPTGFRRAHSTKAGVWGVIRMAEGKAQLRFFDGTPDQLVTERDPAVLRPQQLHLLEPIGHVRLKVDFYDRPPRL